MANPKYFDMSTLKVQFLMILFNFYKKKNKNK